MKARLPSAVLLTLAFVAAASPLRAATTLPEVAVRAQARVVKIYGAGGFRGLEAYQSGFLIAPDGVILTVWSYVLDSDVITVVLDDGRKYEARLLGADPRLELAVLKIDAANLPYFDLQQAAVADVGTRVLAISNLFGIATGDEPASVQQGTVAAKSRLEARRGVFETPYRGNVYVLDAVTNNPGAAGGALTTRNGELLGMLGKELRNAQTNTWLNYAIPIEELVETVEAIREGRFVPASPSEDPLVVDDPVDFRRLGIVLVPDVLPRTPPFVDLVRPGSPAAKAGLKSDDLIVFVNDRLVQSCRTLRDELARIPRGESLKLSVIRDQQLLDVVLPTTDMETNP